MRKQPHCVVSFFGEGGANQGTFHESLNMAAIWRLPVLFVCENNLYAMSTRFDETFATPTIAARAAGYGFPGEVVDGTDFFAVREATQRAADRARRGEGPTLLEMKTYRYYGHSKSDKREYRTREEEDQWRERDAIEKLCRALEVSDADYAKLDEEVTGEVDDAVAFAMQSDEPPIGDWEEQIYA
jgi:TPP-dependent pyruvate/acetoin dehydrogenase alpha subunit